MLKRPLIMGDKGVMGRRYAAIFKHLGIDHLGMDAGDGMPVQGRYDAILIATPTYMHPQHIRKVFDLGVPILVEKPISHDLNEVLELCHDAEKEGVKLRMVNQYAFLRPIARGTGLETHYNYWRTGSDGLAWDCINILGLAKGAVILQNTSPLWTCTINGDVMSLADMDGAYLRMIESWVGGEHEGVDYIRHAHRAASEFQCPEAL